MKYFFFLGGLFLFCPWLKTEAQSAYCGDVPADPSNVMFVYFPGDLDIRIEGTSSTQADSIYILAYFINNEGTPECAGSILWEQQDVLLTVKGEAIFSEGYSDGELLRFWIEDTDGCLADSVAVQFTAPGMDGYSAFTFSTVEEIEGFKTFKDIFLGEDFFLCEGEEQVLAGPAGAGYSYEWSTGADLPEIVLNQEGDYALTVTYLGCMASDTISVSTAPAPAVGLGPDTIICAGGSLMLDVSCAGCSYVWSTGDTTANLSVITGTTYGVTVTSEAGCEAESMLVVSVIDPPQLFAADTITITTADTLLLTPDGAYLSYLWQNGSTEATLLIIGAGYAPGVHELSLTVEDENGCTWEESLLLIVEEVLATEQAPGAEQPHFFPNPTTGRLHIRLPASLPEISLSVFDPLGRPVRQATLRGPDAALDLSGLPTGVYWLRWSGEGGVGQTPVVLWGGG